MTDRQIEEQELDDIDVYHQTRTLEESILGILKLQLQKPISETRIYEILKLSKVDFGEDFNEDKLRYALATLQKEDLIIASDELDGIPVVEISKDGLRLLRQHDENLYRDVKFRKWLEKHFKS